MDRPYVMPTKEETLRTLDAFREVVAMDFMEVRYVARVSSSDGSSSIEIQVRAKDPLMEMATAPPEVLRPAR